MESKQGNMLLYLAERFASDSIKSLNSTIIFNALRINGVETIEDLKNTSKSELALFDRVGPKRLAIILNMKDYINSVYISLDGDIDEAFRIILDLESQKEPSI